jgi:hypothetical protein
MNVTSHDPPILPSQSIPANQAPAAASAGVLLRGLIDYAGLFPPASLAMAVAATNYESYLHSEFRWMLGRFIVPVARLGEFEEAVNRLPHAPEHANSNWSVSALPSANLSADLALIHEFTNRFAASPPQRKVSIGSLEIKIASAEEIERLSKLIPAELDTYFEIPLNADVSNCLRAVGHSGRRAKIRTGGETPDKFPTPESVAEFMRLCAASNVAFKATAGLHHPIRSLHRLTYQADSASAIMHGFLNVFLAAAFVRGGMDATRAVELMNEQSAASFHFDSEGLFWREHRLALADLSHARRDFAISFGSCSFTEPVEDLRALRLL